MGETGYAPKSRGVLPRPVSNLRLGNSVLFGSLAQTSKLAYLAFANCYSDHVAGGVDVKPCTRNEHTDLVALVTLVVLASR